MAMAMYGDAAVAAAEPQDDDEQAEHEDLGLDLLARARLLCQAANEIALPMLRTVQQLQAKQSPPKAKERKPAKPSRPSTREEDGDTSQQRQKNKNAKSREASANGKGSKLLNTLPPIAAPLPPALSEKKTSKPLTKPVQKKKREDDDDAAMPLPQINATDEWRKQRETEKIRQAQERAKARVLRKTNHADPLPPKSNQLSEEVSGGRPPSSESAKEGVESQLEANRRRALERIKLRKLELAEEQARVATAKQDAIAQPPTEELVKKTEAFRHRTLQRLQAAKREAHAQDTQAAAAESEKASAQPAESDEKEQERKRLAKQRRRETAERLKRQQLVAEEQQRKEQELFEKGLNDFKTKKKEQDRVAKGLPPKRSQMEPDPVVVFEQEAPESSSPEPTPADKSASLTGVHDQPVASVIIEDTETNEGADVDASEGLSLSISALGGRNEIVQPLSAEGTNSRPRPKKVPSWKQPPVPILPTECYAQKAMVSPSDSYSEKFQLRTGRASPNGFPEATSKFSPPQAKTSRHGRRSSQPLPGPDPLSSSNEATSP